MFAFNALCPTAVLLTAVKLFLSDSVPKAVLLLPVVFSNKEARPTATFSVPTVESVNH